ncbi:hypothetical protein BDF14DRAFT_1758524 [Spinellus fusiger]|nr:hypothetical protein BDF14DRAFT_1758524 [Spinellus fusiger]
MAMSWWSHFTCLPLYLFRHHLMRRQFHLEGSLPNVIVAMGPEQRIPDREDQSLSLLSHKRPLSDGHNHEGTQWACHKSVLAKHSSYFAAMFDSEFSESRATIVFLPRGMFTLGALDTIMHSMYADELQADTPQLLGDIYFAADYLGMPVLCRNVADRLETLAHHFTCYCETCQDNVPHILDVCRTHGQSQQGDQNMLLLAQAAIKIMTHDPDRTLQTYYTSPSLAEQLSDLPQVQHHLQEKILSRINKSNAIESLYACFVGINTLDAVDRTKDWSAPLHTTLEAVHAMTTQMIATHFRFYCSQYPSLLSCVDGISYTPEFLAYLFTEILSQDMEGDKVITFYTGIVRHLMCRHAVQHCERVRTILQAAKETVVNHIAAHVDTLREEHVFDTLNKDLLETLAQGNYPSRRDGERDGKKKLNRPFHPLIFIPSSSFSSCCILLYLF